MGFMKVFIKKAFILTQDEASSLDRRQSSAIVGCSIEISKKYIIIHGPVMYYRINYLLIFLTILSLVQI